MDRPVRGSALAGGLNARSPSEKPLKNVPAFLAMVFSVLTFANLFANCRLSSIGGSETVSEPQAIATSIWPMAILAALPSAIASVAAPLARAGLLRQGELCGLPWQAVAQKDLVAEVFGALERDPRAIIAPPGAPIIA